MVSVACTGWSIAVALFTRAWIEIELLQMEYDTKQVALFTRAWIEIDVDSVELDENGKSPSSRGRGLKCADYKVGTFRALVALFTRAWIEISLKSGLAKAAKVALFTRAWIEITFQ